MAKDIGFKMFLCTSIVKSISNSFCREKGDSHIKKKKKQPVKGNNYKLRDWRGLYG